MTMSHHHHAQGAGSGSLNSIAFSATVHCLTGCAIGEVLGMVIGTALGWSNLATIVLSVLLAFLFGYGLTMLPLLRSGMAFKSAAGVAPSFAYFATTSADRSNATTWCLLRSRRSVMLPPILPRPIIASCIWCWMQEEIRGSRPQRTRIAAPRVPVKSAHL
jgi:hypothetical protein